MPVMASAPTGLNKGTVAGPPFFLTVALPDKASVAIGEHIPRSTICPAKATAASRTASIPDACYLTNVLSFRFSAEQRPDDMGPSRTAMDAIGRWSNLST